MFKVPLTFLYDFEHVSDALRSVIFAEFARYGAEYLVLSDVLISQIIEKPGLEDRLLKEMEDVNLRFCDAHAPFGQALDMNCPWEGKRPMMIARLKLALEICRYMQVDTITIHLGNNHYEPACSVSDEKNIARMKESLSELLPVAEKLGITICIENIWFSVNTPDILNSIKEEFPTEALGFCYDSGHANIMDNGRNYATGNAWKHWKPAGYSVPCWEDRALEKMLPHVVNCHLHDNTGWNDAHQLPGKGSVNWEHIIKVLKKAPRLKVVQSEVLPVRAGVNIPELTARFKELGEIE